MKRRGSGAGRAQEAPPVDVDVRAIASGGAGVADLPDGRVVFVPRTAPGDRARIRIERSRPRWAVGALDRLVEASPERREAPCTLYHVCGGCQLQHLPYESQLAWKGRAVSDALERIAGIRLDRVPEVVASPRRLGYRSRVTLTLRRLGRGRVVAGFHALGRPGRIVDVQDECLLPEPSVRAAWRALRAGWGEGAALLPAGRLLRLTLRAEREGVTLLVEGGGSWKADELQRAIPSLAAVWHAPNASERTHGGPGRGRGARTRPRLVAGNAERLNPLSFEQVNREAADLLRPHVLHCVGRSFGGPPAVDVPGPASGGLRDGDDAPVRPSTSAKRTGRGGAPLHVVDAYCGAAPYGRALAELGWRVTGIERDRSACRVARAGAPAGFRVLEGAVEDRLSDALPADVVLLNPPRGGLHAEVPRRILAHPPRGIVYVSCDAGTLARDVAALGAAYDLTEVRCFDLFPQTAHVETVVVLETAARGTASADTAAGAPSGDTV